MRMIKIVWEIDILYIWRVAAITSWRMTGEELLGEMHP